MRIPFLSSASLRQTLTSQSFLQHMQTAPPKSNWVPAMDNFVYIKCFSQPKGILDKQIYLMLLIIYSPSNGSARPAHVIAPGSMPTNPCKVPNMQKLKSSEHCKAHEVSLNWCKASVPNQRRAIPFDPLENQWDSIRPHRPSHWNINIHLHMPGIFRFCRNTVKFFWALQSEPQLRLGKCPDSRLHIPIVAVAVHCCVLMSELDIWNILNSNCYLAHSSSPRE